MVTKEFPTWFDLYIDMFEDEVGGDSMLIGGRFFNRDDTAENTKGLVEAFRVAAKPPGLAAGILVRHIVGPGHGMPEANNAIHPR